MWPIDQLYVELGFWLWAELASYTVYYLLSVHSVEKKSGHKTGAFKVHIIQIWFDLNPSLWACFLRNCKVHIFRESHKIFQNLHHLFVRCIASQIIGGDFIMLNISLLLIMGYLT